MRPTNSLDWVTDFFSARTTPTAAGGGCCACTPAVANIAMAATKTDSRRETGI
jgi:hypothetical protein